MSEVCLLVLLALDSHIGTRARFAFTSSLQTHVFLSTHMIFGHCELFSVFVCSNHKGMPDERWRKDGEYQSFHQRRLVQQ